jgi:hypothetical protein
MHQSGFTVPQSQRPTDLGNLIGQTFLLLVCPSTWPILIKNQWTKGSVVAIPFPVSNFIGSRAKVAACLVLLIRVRKLVCFL